MYNHNFHFLTFTLSPFFKTHFKLIKIILFVLFQLLIFIVYFWKNNVDFLKRKQTCF